MMQYQEADIPPPIVEVDAGGYMLEMLFEARPTRPTEMGGPRALSWIDVNGFLACYPIEVDHEERALMISMSEAYVAGLSEGASLFSIAPMDRDGAV